MVRRLAIVAGGVFAVWLVVLVILDRVLEGRQVRHVTDRVGESLHATVTIGDSNLALVRGRLELGQLAVKRDDVIGQLSIDVAEIRCELAPLGWALVDSECSELAVNKVRFDVSAAALLELHAPKRPPIHAGRLVIDDAVLTFSPSAFVPGLGKIQIAIDHAESGPTVLRTPLSWIFTLEQLRANIELPAGIALRLTYEHGMLSATGTMFGSQPVSLPLRLPIASAAADAREEVRLLLELGKDIAERLVAKRAEDWLKRKLSR